MNEKEPLKITLEDLGEDSKPEAATSERSKLADGAVTSAKIANGGVTSDDIVDGGVNWWAKGTGNINGNSDMFQLANPGYLYLDSSDPTAGPGLMNGSLTGHPVLPQGLRGTFNISPSVYLTYKDVAIGFKVGEGQLDPDWAVFQLAPNTLTGTWAVSGNQALSHAMR